VSCEDAGDAIRRAADSIRGAGAITAALYATDEAIVAQAQTAFARVGTNLSVNLAGGIFVNQSAAFSDFHATGANPAANASYSDSAFVANRFRVIQRRAHVAPAAAPAAA
jgi:hypothetical protein